MNKSDNSKSVTIHRRVKSVNNVDRSQVKRPTAKNTAPAKQTKQTKSSASEATAIKVKKNPVSTPRSKMISHFSNTMPTESSIGVRVAKSESKSRTTKTTETETVVMHPMLRTARARMQERRMMMVAPRQQEQQSAITAREMKEAAIKKALASTARATEKEEVKPHKIHFSFGRILIALGCTAAAVFSIIYFINLNMSDFSLYAAAKQAGIESASREPHVPQEYVISNISSENGKIEITYKNSQTNEIMTITEEKSSWDSNALLSNYVRDAYSNTFITIREQGLTIYISESNACWVNGGIVYKITAPVGSLSKKQIRQIATSL